MQVLPPGPTADTVTDSDEAAEYWDTTPIKKARWFHNRLDKLATADPRFVTLCETSTVLVKGQVAVLDSGHAYDYH